MVPSSIGRYIYSTLVDEGRIFCVLLVIKMKARTVVRRVEQGPLCGLGSGLLLGGRARVVLIVR